MKPLLLILAITFLLAFICLALYAIHIKQTLDAAQKKLDEALSAPAQYVETYRGWVIMKVKDCFHPPAGYHEYIYIACKDEQVILGVDLPDLIADIDEAER